MFNACFIIVRHQTNIGLKSRHRGRCKVQQVLINQSKGIRQRQNQRAAWVRVRVSVRLASDPIGVEQGRGPWVRSWVIHGGSVQTGKSTKALGRGKSGYRQRSKTGKNSRFKMSVLAC